MPLFFQHNIDDETKLAVWHIQEEEAFFLQHVPLQRTITHAHKRLQHLAGRYLLQYLFPDFPINLIKIADTRKPYLEGEAYHFSISHCSQYAAVIVSRHKRVGVDIEVPTPKVRLIRHKFLAEEEWDGLHQTYLAENSWWVSQGEKETELLTLLWSAKEAMFKWWGAGDVDFRSMLNINAGTSASAHLQSYFQKDSLSIPLPVHWQKFDGLVLAWIATEPMVMNVQ